MSNNGDKNETYGMNLIEFVSVITTLQQKWYGETTSILLTVGHRQETSLGDGIYWLWLGGQVPRIVIIRFCQQ